MRDLHLFFCTVVQTAGATCQTCLLSLGQFWSTVNLECFNTTTSGWNSRVLYQVWSKQLSLFVLVCVWVCVCVCVCVCPKFAVLFRALNSTRGMHENAVLASHWIFDKLVLQCVSSNKKKRGIARGYKKQSSKEDGRIQERCVYQQAGQGRKTKVRVGRSDTEEHQSMWGMWGLMLTAVSNNQCLCKRQRTQTICAQSGAGSAGSAFMSWLNI